MSHYLSRNGAGWRGLPMAVDDQFGIRSRWQLASICGQVISEDDAE